MILKNWQDMEPRIRKQGAIEWIMMREENENNQLQGEGLKSHKYISRMWLQKGMVLEQEDHFDEEEVFYIVNGTGSVIILGQRYTIKNGDTIYITAKENYQIINEKVEPLEIIAFGADVEKKAEKFQTIVIKNWKDVIPWLSFKNHGYGIDWRIMSKANPPKLNKSILSDGEVLVSKPKEVDKMCMCFQTIKFFSFAMLQPGKSYNAHGHFAHEEVYYIIKGNGIIRNFKEDNTTEDINLQPGDVCVTPIGEKHQLINNGKEFIEFIAWGVEY